VFDEDGIVVRAFRVNHAPIEPAFGYRVEFGGRVVGISGDTTDAPGLRALAADADVLVGEVMDKHFVLDMSCALGRVGNSRSSEIFRDIMDYHIDSLELAQLSEDVGVKTLMLTHMIPTLPSDQARIYFTGPIQKRFSGTPIVSDDGSSVTLDL
jgi:ribonuclease Z